MYTKPAGWFRSAGRAKHESARGTDYMCSSPEASAPFERFTELCMYYGIATFAYHAPTSKRTQLMDEGSLNASG